MKQELNKEVVKELAKTQGTGKYIFSAGRLIQNIQEIKQAFSSVTPDFIPAYSVKANYSHEVLKIANQHHLSFDVASTMELDVVLRAGIAPKNIWVNTPWLTNGLLEKSIQLNIQINADSIDQLLQIEREAERQNKKNSIGIRFCFSDTQHSRFGIEATEESLYQLTELLRSLKHLHVHTLHTHFSGPDRSAQVLAKRSAALFDLYKKWFKNTGVKAINIGGGMSGTMPDELVKQFNCPNVSWQEYARTMNEYMPDFSSSGLTLAIEPGMALVADAFYFLSEVVQIKTIHTKNIAILNTSTLFLKPTGHSRQLSFEVSSEQTSEHKKRYELTGITCMENDILGNFEGTLKPGDLIIFENVGAYTLSYRPNFIFAEPEIIILQDKKNILLDEAGLKTTR